MSITEAKRHHLHQQLATVLGKEDAAVLMEHLPPVGWADVATKRDLDHNDRLLRADLAKVRTELGTDITKVRTELGTDIAKVRTELGADIAKVRTELGADITKVRTELGADITKVGADITTVRTELGSKLEGLEHQIDAKVSGLDARISKLHVTLSREMLLAQTAILGFFVAILHVMR